MMATGQELVDGYLQRLAAATADLPPDVRDDLLTDVRTHLLEAQERAASDVEVRAALDRLGSRRGDRRGSPRSRGPGGGRSVDGAPTSRWDRLDGTAPGRAAPAGPHRPRRRRAGPRRDARERTTSSLGYDVTALLTLLFGAVALTVVLGFVGTSSAGSSASACCGRRAPGPSGRRRSARWCGRAVSLPLLPRARRRAGVHLGVRGDRRRGERDGTVQTYVEPGSAIAEQCTGFAMPLWLGIPVLIVTIVAAADRGVGAAATRRRPPRRAVTERQSLIRSRRAP
jgi:hypothetical protein